MAYWIGTGYAFSHRPLSDRGLYLFEQAGTFLTLTPQLRFQFGTPPWIWRLDVRTRLLLPTGRSFWPKLFH